MPFLDEEAMAVAQQALAQPGTPGPPGTNGSAGANGLGFTATVRQTGDQTATNANLANTSLLFALTSGVVYGVRFAGSYRSSVLTVGLKLGLTVPAFTSFSAEAKIGGFAADGAGSEWQGVINSSGDSVIATAVAVINVDTPWEITGVIEPSASGNLTVQFAAETTGATVTLRRGSVGLLSAVP
jgi:hypothetical protein